MASRMNFGSNFINMSDHSLKGVEVEVDSMVALIDPRYEWSITGVQLSMVTEKFGVQLSRVTEKLNRVTDGVGES